MSTRAIARAILGVGLALCVASSAAAQSYPAKPIKLIVPVAAGGPLDTVARLAADKMTARLGQPVIVENRAGGGTSIGAGAWPSPSPTATRCCGPPRRRCACCRCSTPGSTSTRGNSCRSRWWR